MLRIRLPSGEEIQYDTSELFTAAVRSGGVKPDATIFHAKSERWLPVSSHPAFRLAMASMPLPSPVPIIGERSASTATALVAPSPLYAEPRRQPSRGAEGLGRPDDARSDLLVLGLASCLVVGIIGVAYKRPFSSGAAEPRQVVQQAAAAITWTRVSAPGTLALHHSAREANLVSALSNRLHILSVPRPLLPASVDEPELLEQALIRLRAARDSIEAYRKRAIVLDRAYSDSTGRVGQNDAAPLAPLLAEPDSSYAIAQSITALLLAEKGRFTSNPDTVKFERPTQGAEYSRLVRELDQVVTSLRGNPRFSMLPPPVPDLPKNVARP